MNAEIYRAMRYRDSLISLYKSTTSELYLVLARRQMNVVNTLIETAKKNYIINLLNRSSSCPKKFWRNINQLLKGANISNQSPKFINPSTNEEIQIGYEANDFYCNISGRIGLNPDMSQLKVRCLCMLTA